MALRTGFGETAGPWSSECPVIKYTDAQDDIESRTTRSPTASDSDFDRLSFDSSEQDTTPKMPQKTSLKSVKDKARMFVPSFSLDSQAETVDVPAPPMPMCMPSLGKESLCCIIGTTFGSSLWNLSMMDYTTYEGEWCTNVEITIPARSASMLSHQNANALCAAQQQTHSEAMATLTQALSSQPGVVLQPSGNVAQLRAEFCAGDKTRLCRDFCNFGSCSRIGTCRWEHALVETFLISFILAEVATASCIMTCSNNTSDTGSRAPAAEKKNRWQPQRAPMPSSDTSAGSPSSTEADEASSATSSGAEEDSRRVQAARSAVSTVRRQRNPRFASRKDWADIMDDEDLA